MSAACSRAVAAALVALALAARAGAQFPLSPSSVTFVPWHVLNAGDDPVRADLVLYWIPASHDDVRHSPLLTSRALALDAAQCVGMQVIRPGDDGWRAKLGVSDEALLPAAVLVDGRGVEVGRVRSAGGALSGAAVEKMVREALAARESEADRLLDEAVSKAAAGDLEGAAGLYRRICAQQCLLPRKVRDAERALRKLGVGGKSK